MRWGGKGKIAVFNAFSNSLRICGIRYDLWKYVLQDYPGIKIIQPELAEHPKLLCPGYTLIAMSQPTQKAADYGRF